MNITFEKSPFLQPVTDLLREMDKAGFFSHGLLIGSWPMLIYSEYFTLPYGLATNDIDFAIDNAVKIPSTGGETIPQILERLGYTSVLDYSGIETFLQGTFEVEFITHSRGGAAPSAVVIPPWKVSAQQLPFIDLLFIRPIMVGSEDFTVRIPSPETLLLHKLIIAQRRTGRDREFKKEKDLQQCSVLAEAVRSEEILQITREYRLSKDARALMCESCAAIGIPFQSLGIK
ncbi:MAG: GSU2403 family nucleotidyltransferase fold protein [Desulfuromonadaceae bacterium]|nr:GSU2403 family nucleotidyltransferase fold protein [Desulfuromonadaceae bacterium]